MLLSHFGRHSQARPAHGGFPAIAGAAACFGLIALAGCHGSDAPTSASSDTATASAPDQSSVDSNGDNRATSDAAQGISASDGRLILPPVAGHPAAAYFSIRNGKRQTVDLVSVKVAGASTAQMHSTQGGAMKPVDDLRMDPGAQLSFAPGGLHVMVFGLPASIRSGDTVQMTLTFAGGETLTMPLHARTMNADMGTAPENPAEAPSEE